MKKTALLFPGQGAQYPGMGADIYQKYPEARAVFEEAAAALGASFIDTIFKGPEEKLRETAYTQPAILTVSTAIFRVLEARGLNFCAAAGLSLGEYSALTAAGSLSFAEALPLVQRRGTLMQEATPEGTGSMVAIMGLGHSVVKDICQRSSEEGIVSPANYNCPGQIVVSGEKKALERACKLAGEAGAKKITALKVSAPFHCKLLEAVEPKLSEALELVEVKKPQITLYFNVTAQPETDPAAIRANLVRQVSSPILWEQSIGAMIKDGVDSFVSVGPGNSLHRLMKRISPDSYSASIEKIDQLEEFKIEGV